MHGDGNHVIIIGKPEQERPDKRSSREIERTLNLCGNYSPNFEVPVLSSSV